MLEIKHSKTRSLLGLKALALPSLPLLQQLPLLPFLAPLRHPLRMPLVFVLELLVVGRVLINPSVSKSPLLAFLYSRSWGLFKACMIKCLRSRGPIQRLLGTIRTDFLTFRDYFFIRRYLGLFG